MRDGGWEGEEEMAWRGGGEVGEMAWGGGRRERER